MKNNIEKDNVLWKFFVWKKIVLDKEEEFSKIFSSLLPILHKKFFVDGDRIKLLKIIKQNFVNWDLS